MLQGRDCETGTQRESERERERQSEWGCVLWRSLIILRRENQGLKITVIDGSRVRGCENRHEWVVKLISLREDFPPTRILSCLMDSHVCRRWFGFRERNERCTVRIAPPPGSANYCHVYSAMNRYVLVLLLCVSQQNRCTVWIFLPVE